MTSASESRQATGTRTARPAVAMEAAAVAGFAAASAVAAPATPELAAGRDGGGKKRLMPGCSFVADGGLGSAGDAAPPARLAGAAVAGALESDGCTVALRGAACAMSAQPASLLLLSPSCVAAALIPRSRRTAAPAPAPSRSAPAPTTGCGCVCGNGTAASPAGSGSATRMARVQMCARLQPPKPRDANSCWPASATGSVPCEPSQTGCIAARIVSAMCATVSFSRDTTATGAACTSSEDAGASGDGACGPALLVGRAVSCNPSPSFTLLLPAAVAAAAERSDRSISITDPAACAACAGFPLPLPLSPRPAFSRAARSGDDVNAGAATRLIPNESSVREAGAALAPGVAPAPTPAAFCELEAPAAHDRPLARAAAAAVASADAAIAGGSA